MEGWTDTTFVGNTTAIPTVLMRRPELRKQSVLKGLQLVSGEAKCKLSLIWFRNSNSCCSYYVVWVEVCSHHAVPDHSLKESCCWADCTSSQSCSRMTERKQLLLGVCIPQIIGKVCKSVFCCYCWLVRISFLYLACLFSESQFLNICLGFTGMKVGYILPFHRWNKL